jgi:polyribonucleotide nucleotidyltransferase
MSLNPEVDGDIPPDRCLGRPRPGRHPFMGPIGAAKVGYKNGQYI